VTVPFFNTMTGVSKILMYTTKWCPFCVMAKRLLATKGVAVEEVAVDTDPTRRAEMMQRSGRRTVPQIFIGERHVGGFEDIAALDHKGELDPLLADPTRSS
jgi:glutaredoxin 3